MPTFEDCGFLFVKDFEYPVETGECMCKFKHIHQPSNCSKCSFNEQSDNLVLEMED